MAFVDRASLPDIGSPTDWLAEVWRRVYRRATAPQIDAETGLLAESEFDKELRSALDASRTMTGELTLIAAKMDGLERVERELGPVVEELEAFAFDDPNLEEPIVLRPSTVRYPEDGTTSAELLSALSAGRRST